MKHLILFIVLLSITSFTVNAQRNTTGFVDTEYVLQNITEYQEASAQLDKKVLLWKNEIQEQLELISQKKVVLENEKPLLTKELYEERMEDLNYEEKEVMDYKQKRFGAEGDMISFKKQLMQPIQDQIYTAVKEIATKKNLSYVFDKSSEDVVMIYTSGKRLDLSDQVIKIISRSYKRSQALSKQERKKLEKEEIAPEVNEELEKRNAEKEEQKNALQIQKEEEQKKRLEARQKIIDERNKARQKLLEDRLAAREKLKEKQEKARELKLKERERLKKEKEMERLNKEKERKEQQEKDKDAIEEND